MGLSKKNSNKKKLFKLNINIPKGLSLIYPKKEDLKKGYYRAPPIIAGSFNEFTHKDFCVYVKNNLEYDKKRMSGILNTIENAFNYFQNIFLKKKKS